MSQTKRRNIFHEIWGRSWINIPHTTLAVKDMYMYVNEYELPSNISHRHKLK